MPGVYRDILNLFKNKAGGVAGLDANNEIIRSSAGAAAQVALGHTGARKRANGTWDGVSILLPTGYDLNIWADNLVSGQVYNVLSPLNAPSTGWWHVEILRHNNDAIGNQYRTLRITAMVSTGYPNGTIFTASDVLGTWSAWRRIATDEPLVWTPLTLLAGHASIAASPCGYTKDSIGGIRLHGVFGGGSGTNGTVIANLPFGYRPSIGQRFASFTADGTHYEGTLGWLAISANGNITIVGGLANGAAFYLDNIYIGK